MYRRIPSYVVKLKVSLKVDGYPVCGAV
jgi:hypothetical protein